MLKDNLIKLALKLAEKSYKKSEVPVGCVVFDEKMFTIFVKQI